MRRRRHALETSSSPDFSGGEHVRVCQDDRRELGADRDAVCQGVAGNAANYVRRDQNDGPAADRLVVAGGAVAVDLIEEWRPSNEQQTYENEIGAEQSRQQARSDQGTGWRRGRVEVGVAEPDDEDESCVRNEQKAGECGVDGPAAGGRWRGSAWCTYEHGRLSRAEGSLWGSRVPPKVTIQGGRTQPV